jgi:hypothetical protein
MRAYVIEVNEPSGDEQPQWSAACTCEGVTGFGVGLTETRAVTDAVNACLHLRAEEGQ